MPKEVTKERIGIALPIFPNWRGQTVTRYVSINKELRFDTEIPVPATDEEAQAVFGCTIADLIEKGAKQMSYDRDTNIGNLIKEDQEKGVDFGKLEDVSKYATEFEAELSTPKERKTSAVKENKVKASKYDALKKELGAETDEELAEIIARAKAKKKA